MDTTDANALRGVLVVAIRSCEYMRRALINYCRYLEKKHELRPVSFQFE